MNNYFSHYKKLFLNAEDVDLKKLHNSIGFIFKEISKKFSKDRAVLCNESLKDVFSDQIPETGKKSEKVLGEIIPAFKDIIQWNHPSTLHNKIGRAHV